MRPLFFCYSIGIVISLNTNKINRDLILFKYVMSIIRDYNPSFRKMCFYDMILSEKCVLYKWKHLEKCVKLDLTC